MERETLERKAQKKLIIDRIRPVIEEEVQLSPIPEKRPF